MWRRDKDSEHETANPLNVNLIKIFNNFYIFLIGEKYEVNVYRSQYFSNFVSIFVLSVVSLLEVDYLETKCNF